MTTAHASSLGETLSKSVRPLAQPIVHRYRLWQNDIRYDNQVRIPVDGQLPLQASLYLPDQTNQNDAPLATILVMLPYGRHQYGAALRAGVQFGAAGFAVLTLDLRGYESDSMAYAQTRSVPWAGVTQDASAVLDWIVQQPWSNGRVGTFGCSALGETQFALAKANHPANRAMHRTTALFALTILFASSNPAVADDSDDDKLRIICFGAHPDDAEYKTGGTAALWAAQGHHVKLVSVTNGDIGHWQMAGGPLAKRRTTESTLVAERLGVTAEILDIHDGELLPTLENRRIITRLIRDWNADIVIAHRPWDYHPDHRYVGVLVQDAAFMVTVPFFCPDSPHLTKNPVFLYSSDRFKKPYPFEADIAVSIDSVFDKKIDALMALESQIFEGGANGNEEKMAEIPPASQPEARREFLKQRWIAYAGGQADDYRSALVKWYGDEQAKDVKFAEAWEICEYGRQPSEAEIRELFPFFPAAQSSDADAGNNPQ